MSSSPATRMHGSVQEISLAFATVTIPMVAFSAILLALIYHFQITHNGFVSTDLSFDGGADEPGVVYVQMSATTLTTIASWSSTAAPILVGFIITLMSYPVARDILYACRQNNPKDLPTPYQLALMLRIQASSSIGSLYHWFLYSAGWKGRESQGRALKTLVSILFFGILLSILVFATDTWLHFTTKTVNFTQVHPNNIASNFSFTLSGACTNLTSAWVSGCTLNRAAANVFLMAGPTTLAVLGNISATTLVKTHISPDGTKYSYLGIPNQARLANVDYKASSWALKSQCSPVTSQCFGEDSLITGPYASFNCPFDFKDNITTNYESAIRMAYFPNSTAVESPVLAAAVSNTYYYSVVSSTNQNVGRTQKLINDPEITSGLHGATLFALFCSATVYEVVYTSVNNTITSFTLQDSNISTTNIIQGSQQYTYVGNQNLMQASSIAGLTANSAQEVADQFSLAYSGVALGAASGAFVPQPAILSQLRNNILVARVPLAPLICLIAANLLMVFLGIVLAVMAYIAVQGDTGEAQARMSIPGVVAALFEGSRAEMPVKSPEELFVERSNGKGPRIGLIPSTGGGWRFGAWHPAPP